MDEVGRGPLAGNVVTACVVMPEDPVILWIDDSKKLSESRREKVFDEIMTHAIYVGIGEVTPEEIDRINILEATRKAMQEAASQIPADIFLIDAVTKLGLNGREIPIIKGDATSYNIAAASIIAKVTRDRQMIEMDRLYPEYGFKRNKGYGTREHIEALKKFCMKQTYDTGLSGEQQAAEWLKNEYGMQMLTQRCRTKAGEIDLIMADGETIVFVEVKTRLHASAGNGVLAVDRRKQQRITKASILFLMKMGWKNRAVRYDIVEVRPDGILYIPNAFQPGGMFYR
jgi:ribonuclease HII